MATKVRGVGSIWSVKIINTVHDYKIVQIADTQEIRDCLHDRMARFRQFEDEHQCIFCKEIFKLEVDPDTGEDRYLQQLKQ